MDGGTFNEGVAREIRRLREARGLSQAQLAARSYGALTQSAIAGYESDHRAIRVSVLWHLALALGVSVASIITAAETTLRSSAGPDTPVKISRRALLASTEPALQPVKNWVQAVGDNWTSDTITLDTPAIDALSILLRTTPSACRARLNNTDLSPQRT